MRPNSGDLYSGRKGAWALTQMRNFIESAKVKLKRSLSGVVIVLRLRYTAPAVDLVILILKDQLLAAC